MSDIGITPVEYRSRVERVRAMMAAHGLDAVVAYANKTHPGHVRYLTGYEPRLGIHDSAACVVTADRAILVTNASFDRPQQQTWLCEVIVTGDYAAAVAEILGAPVRSVGLAGFRALPAPVYLGLHDRMPGTKLRDVSELLLTIRQVKSPTEIALLRETARITDAGGRAFLDAARPGVTERDVLVQVEAALKRAGSDEVSFSTQICSGPRTAQVVAFATDAVLSDNTLVQLDCGGSFHGYRGDLSRVAYIGFPSGRVRQLIEVTVEIYERCLERMRPGVACADVARLAIQVAERHSLADFLYRSPNHEPGFVGHGIGLSYTEPPEVHPDSDAVFLENSVVVLEPILADPEVGGVKLEDPVLITHDGPERLSRLPVWEASRS